jgi:AcrR family transcriptional regulator
MAARSTELDGTAPRRQRLPALERREQILEVAQDAFVRAGYRGTTALEIGREAGVSEKLVLKHFGSKEGLFRAAVVEPLLALMTSANQDARARMAAGPGDDSPEQAFARVHRFLSMWAALVRERAPLIVAFIAEMRDFPDVAAQLAALFVRQVDETTEILSLGMRDGAFRPFDPRVAFLAALGAATVAAFASEDADAFLDEYLKLTLFGVLTDEARVLANGGP